MSTKPFSDNDKPHCPRCDSPDPQRHPAMQWEGEVQPCPDPWHWPDGVPEEVRTNFGAGRPGDPTQETP